MPKANKEIFNILKSVVDNKAAKIQQTIADGAEADIKVKEISQTIQAMERYIINNRFCGSDVRETREEISEYEGELSHQLEAVTAANHAEKQLPHIAAFNTGYAAIMDMFALGEHINKILADCGLNRLVAARSVSDWTRQLIEMDSKLQFQIQNHRVKQLPLTPEFANASEQELLKLMQQHACVQTAMSVLKNHTK